MTFLFTYIELFYFFNIQFWIPSRLQELEDQYRKEREEASNLLEQQRLVSTSSV